MASKGQSTVEYLLLVTAVITVVIMFTMRQNNGFQSRLTNVLHQTTYDMTNAVNRVSGATY
jgi:uncharacterized protein (UPF0333 family)